MAVVQKKLNNLYIDGPKKYLSWKSPRIESVIFLFYDRPTNGPRCLMSFKFVFVAASSTLPSAQCILPLVWIRQFVAAKLRLDNQSRIRRRGFV